MTITSRTATLGAACLLAAAAAGFAAEPPVPDFKALDTNADGKLSLAEAKGRAELQGVFEMLDRNADGYLSAEEFAGWGGGGRHQGAPTKPVSPETAPGGSAGAQHMPKRD